MASRRRRVLWVAGLSVASGVALWLTLRFGVMAWLSDKNAPVRPVVEALSWVAGVAGFVVALVALMLARRPVGEASDTGGAPGSTGKDHPVYWIKGFQMGNRNKQKNIFYD